MRINLNYVMPLFVAFVLLIGGCSGTGSSGGAKLAPFVGGTQGLEFAFMEGAPPAYIYDSLSQMGYNLQVKMENKGEVPIESGQYTVKIVGIDPQEFGLDAGEGGTDSIDPVKKDIDGNTIPGGITYWTFSSASGYAGTILGDTTFNVRADVCYKYGAIAEAMYCAKQDILDTDREKNPVCLVNEPKQIANAGSPVQIVSFKEEPGGNGKIRFTFQISHRGTGLISAAADCSDDIINENKINILVETDLASQPACSLGGTGTANSGTVQLFNGVRTITCTQDIAGLAGDYQKVLKITMDYYYKDHVSQAITVKHAS